MRFDYLFKETEGVKEAQIVQSRPGEIVIKVVPRASYNKADTTLIVQGVRDWISPTLDVSIELVDHIERSASGKFRPVCSQIQPTT
jgi:phenylacetate-CoA ligase